MSQDRIKQAFEQFRAGRKDEAAQTCRDILADNPENAEINQLLGVIYNGEGKLAEALALFKRAIAAPNPTAEMHSNLGAVLYQLGNAKDAAAAYKQALVLNPNYFEAYNNLGVLYRGTGRLPKAIAAFKKAIELRPDIPQLKTNLRALYRNLVPAWHFGMMNDEIRNNAYDAAIRRAVAGKRVLEIGTGAGLLAMMAARAGAQTVTTCDRVEVIADRAREIVAQNGFAGQVKVVGKESDELIVGEDLPQRAEVLIAEIFGNNLVDEGVIPTLEYAHQHLLTEDAVVVPAAGSVMGYLAGGDILKNMLFVDTCNGFDVSSFNDFGPPIFSLTSGDIPHDILSEEAELLRLDMRQKTFPAQTEAQWLVATKPGVCSGVLQWIRLELDSQTRYENQPGPDDRKTCWGYVVHRFPRPIQVQPGDQVPIVVRHDRKHAFIELAE